MDESSEHTAKNSQIASTTNDESIANIPLLANDLRSTNKNLHYSALQRLMIAIVMDDQNLEAVKQQDIIGILKNFLVSETQPELQELSIAIISVLGTHGKCRERRNNAFANGQALVQIILNSDEILSRQGTEALCRLIVADKEIRNAMLSKRFVDIVLETLCDQEQIKKQSQHLYKQEYKSESNYVKVGLLSVVLKLAEEIEKPTELGILIPILEEIKKKRENELSQKGKSILGCLQQEGISAPQSNEQNEKDEKILQLEETIRRQDEYIRRLNEQQKSNIVFSVPTETVSEDVPYTITVQSGSYTKKEREITYTSTSGEWKTFPISPAFSKGFYRLEMKFNKVGDNSAGVIKPGMALPFGKFPGTPPFTKNSLVFYIGGFIRWNELKIKGNQPIKDGDIVAIELNFLAKPRTAHLFINYQQQPVFVYGLPEKVQFYIFLNYVGDSITVLSLQKLISPSALKTPEEMGIKWE